MQYVGFFLVGLAVIAIIVGFVQRGRGKKIIAAPFRKTAEAAANPQAGDAKGTVSCEGAIQVQQPMMAPCSGRPCIYYEIELTRMWEKTVQTENGTKTEKGTTNISTNRQGSHFYLNDGSGPVAVDARESVEGDLDKSFEQVQNIAWGDALFGQYRASIPQDGGDHRTTGIKCVEKVIAAQGSLFVMGKLAGGTITKTDGMLGKLLASSKGRDKLIGATKRNAMIGFIAGGVLILPGGYFSAFGEPPKDNCANMTDAIAEQCTGRITDDAGTTYDWTVTKPGVYTISVLQPNVKVPIIPVLTVRDAGGLNVTTGSEVDHFTGPFKPGQYKLNVRDSVKGAAARFKGGFSFSLAIKAESTPMPSSGAVAGVQAPAMSGANPVTAPAKLGVKPATAATTAATAAAATAAATAKPATTAAATTAATAKPATTATAVATAKPTAAPKVAPKH